MANQDDTATRDLIHPPTCLKCGAQIVSTHTWVLDGIAEASWLCGNQHQILLKWVA